MHTLFQRRLIARDIENELLLILQAKNESHIRI